MNTKSKLFAAALICCTLVLAFTACAGCTDTDPIVGTYVHTFSDNSGSIVEDFHKDGTIDTYAVYADGSLDKLGPYPWKRTGDNRYESGQIIYKLSNDSHTLTQTTSSGDELEYTRYSNYKVPVVTSIHQMSAKNAS